METGSPSTSVGSYRHCLTAATASSSRIRGHRAGPSGAGGRRAVWRRRGRVGAGDVGQNLDRPSDGPATSVPGRLAASVPTLAAGVATASSTGHVASGAAQAPEGRGELVDCRPADLQTRPGATAADAGVPAIAAAPAGPPWSPPPWWRSRRAAVFRLAVQPPLRPCIADRGESRSTSRTPSRSAVRESARASGSWSRGISGSFARGGEIPARGPPLPNPSVHTGFQESPIYVAISLILPI